MPCQPTAGRDVVVGGDGPAVVLLHGLAGYAREWSESAAWLTRRARVVALDARGHGDSERRPADVSRSAHVADAAFALERLGLAPVAVVGQSLGAQTALLLPPIVPTWCAASSSPRAGRAAAIEFFGGPSLAAHVWADGLEHRDDGWWPRFEIDVMVRTLRDAGRRSYWEEWERIACPTLVVRAGDGSLAAEEARAMAERGRDVQLVEVTGAKHDVHLDRPTEWRRAVSRFLDLFEPPGAT